MATSRTEAVASSLEVHAASVRLLPLGFCQRNELVILGRVDPAGTDAIAVGAVDAVDGALLDALAARFARPVRRVPMGRSEVRAALARAWNLDDGHENAPRALGSDRPSLRADAPAPEHVDDLLTVALSLGATDLHLERYRGVVEVRVRIDGVLHPLRHQLTPDNVDAVVSRIKILAELDIAEHRLPQDGRLRYLPGGTRRRDPVDLRVAISPGPFGEDAVVRVLRTASRPLRLEELGMDGGVLERVLALMRNPEGLFLVTGPTGSGKSTTLYSALSRLNDGTRKVLTAEDPIEVELPRVNQKQVSAVVGMADMLRAFLRQDPDVILVGEIRDEATCETAARAAATGHLVLSTLHTADAVGAVSRLNGLGLDHGEIAESLLGVLAQRLVRRVCVDCSVPSAPTEEQAALFGPLLLGVLPRRGLGCGRCHQTGYRGRLGVFELLVLDQAVQDAVAEGRQGLELRRLAHGRGFRSLVQDGLAKVAGGQTSLEELVRVLPYRYIVAAVEEAGR